MTSRVWLSFDLGIRGDYEGLYAWLDDHRAKECGESVATFTYEYDEDLAAEMAEDLKKVESNRRTRFYLVWRDEEGIKGRFILGARKAAPWQGLGSPAGREAEIDAEV